MKYIKTFENSNNVKERFKVGEYAIMNVTNKRVKILEVTDSNTLWIDYDGNPMEFLTKGFTPESEFDANKYNL